MNLSFLPEPPEGWKWLVQWKLPDKVSLMLGTVTRYEPTLWSRLTGGKGRPIAGGVPGDYVETFAVNEHIGIEHLELRLAQAADKILHRVQLVRATANEALAREKTKRDLQRELTALLGPPQPDVSNWEPAEELR